MRCYSHLSDDEREQMDIAGRRADQPRNGVTLHVFRHVESDDLDAERGCKLPRHFGLADASRAGEQIAADWLFRLAQAGARELDRSRQRLDRLVLTVDDALERILQVLKYLRVILDTAFGGIRAMVAIVVSISLMPMVRLRRPSGNSICAAPDSSITSMALSGNLRSWM
jgi:hypothetical protein